MNSALANKIKKRLDLKKKPEFLRRINYSSLNDMIARVWRGRMGPVNRILRKNWETWKQQKGTNDNPITEADEYRIEANIRKIFVDESSILFKYLVIE